MNLPPLGKWPGYALALFVVLAIGGEIASAKSTAIGSVLSEMGPLIGPALNGDPVAAIALIVIAWTALVLFVAIPGRLGLFKMLKP